MIGSTCCGVSVPVPLLCGLVLCALVKPLPGRRANHIQYHQEIRKPASLSTATLRRRASFSRVCSPVFVKSDIHSGFTNGVFVPCKIPWMRKYTLVGPNWFINFYMQIILWTSSCILHNGASQINLSRYISRLLVPSHVFGLGFILTHGCFEDWFEIFLLLVVLPGFVVFFFFFFFFWWDCLLCLLSLAADY